jgi:hypothetical protein
MLPHSPWQLLGHLGAQTLADSHWGDASGDTGGAQAELSRDCRRVLFLYPQGLRLVDVQTRKPIGQWLRGVRGGKDDDHALSPDGQRLLLTRDGRASVYGTANKEDAGRPLRHHGLVQAGGFSPDGSRAFTIGTEGAVQVWDSKTWQPLARIGGPGLRYDSAKISPDNRLIACWDRAGGVQPLAWWGTESGQRVRAFPDEYHDIREQAVPGPRLDWRPDGQQLLRVTKQGEATLWPAADLARQGQLYSGRHLDAKGGTAPLDKSELEAVWRELLARYPEEFTVSLRAGLECRIRQLQSTSKIEWPFAIAFSRRWLAAELAESGWQPGERGNEDLDRDNYLQRLYALAQCGRSAGAAAAAEALAARWPEDHDTLYGCACVLALAAKAVIEDGALSDRYAARAITLLREAAAVSFKDSQRLSDEPSLDPIVAAGIRQRLHDRYPLLLKDPDLDAVRGR